MLYIKHNSCLIETKIYSQTKVDNEKTTPLFFLITSSNRIGTNTAHARNGSFESLRQRSRLVLMKIVIRVVFDGG
jgi:hypothetical protein